MHLEQPPINCRLLFTSTAEASKGVNPVLHPLLCDENVCYVDYAVGYFN